MINVLIADDEVMIHVMLSKLIDWGAYGFHIVGFVEDGISALERIEQDQSIDLVIADIRMPGLDGIGFIQELRERAYKTKVIFISGHRQFEYAQSGMKFAVEDYILKPIKKDELLATLDHVKKKIEDEKKGIDENKEVERQLQDGKRTLQSNLVKMIALGEIRKEELTDLAQINQQYLCDFVDGLFRFVVFRVDVDGISRSDRVKPEIIQDAVRAFVATLEKQCNQLICYTENAMVTILLNYGASEDVRMEDAMTAAFQTNLNMTEKFRDIHLTLCVGEPAEGLQMAQGSYQQAFECVRARIQYGIGKIIWYSDLNQDDLSKDELFSDEKQNQLSTVMDEINYDEFVRISRELFDLAGEKPEKTYSELWWMIGRYAEIVQSGIQQLCPENEAMEFNMGALYDCTQLSILKEAVVQEGARCYKAAIKTIVVENPFIAASKNYIKKYYRNRITLKDVANIIHLNPVYLSILFKKETGQGFVDYLMSYRVEQSKTYLVNNKYSIAQISEMVGYGDSRHFSRKFRQITGYTPTEYRKIYLRIKK